MKRGLKNPLMRALNLVLYLAFCGLAGTGILLFWRLVPGSRGGRGLTFFGMDRHDWGDVHFWLGVACVAAIVLHLYLHRLWLRKIAASSQAWRLWAGLAVGLAVVSFFGLVPIEGRSGSDQSRDHGEEARVGNGKPGPSRVRERDRDRSGGRTRKRGRGQGSRS